MARLLNSEQMYQALRSLGRETQLIIYPGEYHEIRKPSYPRGRLARYLELVRALPEAGSPGGDSLNVLTLSFGGCPHSP
jgi:hypothetical protein